MTNRAITHIVDEDSNPVALVPLGRKGEKGTAIILDEDLALLESLGLSMRWNRHTRTGIVVAPTSASSGGSVQVARVLLDLGPGQNIRYRNGDPTDLRRDNLEIKPEGNAIRRDRDYLTPKEKRKAWGPPVEHVFAFGSKPIFSSLLAALPR
ncbi:hypothetical protein FY036_06505 [Mesorhizobium microcysteis]|uniref:Uncharacterized protein n=1 Tax=Neoaquamicrobium microcysteis TaxID=2682781 RepID=A0A5D4H0D7_9HYPH|nr:hypothetical protein [Mesorhizobium microcysteis]TYR33703.1 hypothetical protein FY036_06505 [Mesorhizobium microcysteis]